MEACRDICDCLALISHEFRSLNMKPPAAIILASHEDGMQLLGRLHQRAHITIPMAGNRGGTVIEHPDGQVFMEIEFYGLKVQWPAMRMALPDGGYKWL